MLVPEASRCSQGTPRLPSSMTSRWHDGRRLWALLKLLVALSAVGALFYFDMIRLGAMLALFGRLRLVLVTLAVLLATVSLCA
jgi:hypothetical protein